MVPPSTPSHAPGSYLRALTREEEGGMHLRTGLEGQWKSKFAELSYLVVTGESNTYSKYWNAVVI